MYIGLMLFDTYLFESVCRYYLMHGVGIFLLHPCKSFPTALYFVYERYGLFPILELSVAAYAIIVEFRYAFFHQECIYVANPDISVISVFLGKSHGVTDVSVSGIV